MATDENADQGEATEVEEFPAGALVFRTLIHAGSWTDSTGTTHNDLCVIESPSETLIRDAGHAHAAGMIEVLQGLDMTGVQSQEEGEAAQEEAISDGRWQEGQDQQALLEQEARERGDYSLVVETLPPLANLEKTIPAEETEG